MQTAVLDRLSIEAGDTAKVTEIKAQLVTEHLRLVAEERLKLALATLAFVAGTATIALPADWVATESIYSGSVRMQPVSFQDLALRQAGVAGQTLTNTQPGLYTLVVPNIRIWPTPTTSTSTGAVMVYRARPTAMSAAGDLPDSLPAEWHDLLVELAVHRIAMSEEAMDIAAGAKATADELRGRLRLLAANRNGPMGSRIALLGYQYVP
jgi:hypothetical protein